MAEPIDYQRLLQFDYEPLRAKPSRDAVARFRAEHVAAGRGALEMGSDWDDCYRLDAFARANGLTYEPRIDRSPYSRVFGTSSIQDGLTTVDGGVTVGSAYRSGSLALGSVEYSKFVAVGLGHRSAPWKLEPRRHDKKDADRELDRHFEFSSDDFSDAPRSATLTALAADLARWTQAGLSEDEVMAKVHEQQRQGGWLERRRRDRREYKETMDRIGEGFRAQAARLFDDDLGRLIVEHAKGFTIETQAGWVFISRRGVYETVKPDLIQQMFTLAAVLGPPIAGMSGSA